MLYMAAAALHTPLPYKYLYKHTNYRDYIARKNTSLRVIEDIIQKQPYVFVYVEEKYVIMSEQPYYVSDGVLYYYSKDAMKLKQIKASVVSNPKESNAILYIESRDEYSESIREQRRTFTLPYLHNGEIAYSLLKIPEAYRIETEQQFDNVSYGRGVGRSVGRSVGRGRSRIRLRGRNSAHNRNRSRNRTPSRTRTRTTSRTRNRTRTPSRTRTRSTSRTRTRSRTRSRTPDNMRR